MLEIINEHIKENNNLKSEECKTQKENEKNQKKILQEDFYNSKIITNELL